MAQPQRRLSIVVLTVSVALLFGGLSSPPVYSKSKGPFQKGLDCKQRLSSSPSKKKYRHSWERCIRYFKEATLKSGIPKNREEALYRIAELYEGLSRYSGLDRYDKTAAQYYKNVLEQFPSGRFNTSARRALRALGHSVPVSSPLKTAEPVFVQDVNYWSFPSYTRVVLDLAREVHFRKDQLKNPDRLYLDLEDAYLNRKMHNKPVKIEDGILKKINIAQYDQKTVRLVLTLDNIKNYRIVPFDNPDRLVIDVFGKGIDIKEFKDGEHRRIDTAHNLPERSSPNITLAQQLGLGINTIVIDPGHGGKDPGAIGRSGLMEKDVVLDISLRLRDLLQKRLSKKVIMTRETDVFIPLDERTLIANASKADLFISIHSNSSPKRSTKGVEIYLVGQSTDRPAMETAARENSASERAMSDLELILNDLLENTKVDESLELAHMTRQSFRKNLGTQYKKVIDLGVKRAPFYVLINANMPSILAEVAFISNPMEEKRLGNKKYRQRVAEALFDGIRQYIDSIKVASIR